MNEEKTILVDILDKDLSTSENFEELRKTLWDIRCKLSMAYHMLDMLSDGDRKYHADYISDEDCIEESKGQIGLALEPFEDFEY